jgi:hypothetical protein
MPRVDEIELNGVVLGFGAGVSLLTGMLFGVVPAVRLQGGSSPLTTNWLPQRPPG